MTTVWIVARTNRTRDRIARTLAHEAVAHHGLRQILGKDDFARFQKNMKLAIEAGNKPLKAAQDYVRRTYVDAKGNFNLSAADEVDEIAARVVEDAVDPATGEFRPGYSWLKEVWAKVAEFLRGIGIDVKFTRAELHGMLVQAQRNLKAGNRFDGGGELALTARADGFDQAVDKAIGDAMRGVKPEPGYIEVGTPSLALQRAGIPDRPMRTSAAILTKAHYDHGVTKTMLKKLPDLLDNPFLVFDSDTVPGSFVVVTGEEIGGRPLIVAIKPADARGDVFNFVPTLLPKDNPRAIQKWMDAGLLRQRDEKQSPAWFGSFRAPIARGSRPTQGSGGSVGRDAEVDKSAESGDGSILFARSQPDLSAPAPWSAPDDTRIDRVIYELQDGRVDLKRVQEAIAEAGREITEQFDTRLAETLYPGRVAYRSNLFLNQEVKPLLEAMARQNVGIDELADYLHARGASERNAQVAKVNPSMPDGGAGTNTRGVLMTDEAAAEHLAAIPAERRDVLAKLAESVDAITKGTRSLLVAEGLEKADTIAAWERAYKRYVPMFRDEAESGVPHPQGMGFSVKGSSSKRVTGSTKEVTNILAHVLMQREAAITRGDEVKPTSAAPPGPRARSRGCAARRGSARRHSP